MKKGIRIILGVMLSASMTISPVMEAVASNQFYAEVEDVAGELIFPGDSIYGVEPIYLGPDGTVQEITDGSWTNRTEQAFEIGNLDGEEEGLWLQPMGYVLTVKGGTSRLADDDGVTYNHYQDKEERFEEEELPKDVAYYEAWTEVKVKADEPKDGLVFDHWEVEDNKIILEDTYAPEIELTMIDAAVSLTAVYKDAAAEEQITETPATEIPAEDQFIEIPTEVSQDIEVQPAQGEYNWNDSDENGIVVIEDDNTIDNSAISAETEKQLYTLTVENGDGSGEYELGTEITVTAQEMEGKHFVGWITETDTVWFSDSSAPQTTFYMPAENVTVTASYAEEETIPVDTEVDDVPVIGAEFYSVTVEDGIGGGSYEAGEVVTVYADEAPDGEEFAGWVASENIILDDVDSEEASFVMPAQEVYLAATYTEVETDPETEEAPEIVIPEETESEASDDKQAEPEETKSETQTEAETQAESKTQTEAETQAESKSQTEAEAQTGSETQTETEKEVKSYRIDLSDTQISVKGAVLEGGELLAKAGDTVKITAHEYEDRLFQKWKVTRSDTKEGVTVVEEGEDYLTASFTMPESVVYVEAVYTVLQKNEVQVVNGSGSGTYLEGDYVEIEADEAPEGQRFKKWTVITGDIELEDKTSEVTGFMMPDETVQVKAVYEVIKYTLTVNNGSGSGSYKKGESISLTANYPASGKEFDAWKVTSNNASVSAADRYYSSITMPAANVTVEATYKDGPSPDYNEIQNIVSGGEYLKGQTINFTAVGNGMANTNPNPGDYRYRPIGYQIGSVSGNWNNAPYTTSMAINAVGQYTLTVSYSKDVFDGSNWVADGTTAKKSVTFYVVNALSVQTGDSSPIIPLVITAAVALAVVIILLLIRKKRK